jgi:hypothetical protein
MATAMLNTGTATFRHRRRFSQAAPFGARSPLPAMPVSARAWRSFCRPVPVPFDVARAVHVDVERRPIVHGDTPSALVLIGERAAEASSHKQGERESPATERRCTTKSGSTRGQRKGSTVAAPHHHDLLDEMAAILNTAAGDLASASIQELEQVCRDRGASLLVVVRSAESALQRLQQDRDGNIQGLGDHDQILDGPTRPPS